MTGEDSKLVQARAVQDRAWAAAREKKPHIDRVAREGPDGSEHDHELCRFLANMVSGDLSLRSYLAEHPEPDPPA